MSLAPLGLPTPTTPSGAIIYHGPVAEVLPHFAALGFDCPPRKDVASFLQEVATPAGQAAYASPALREGKGLPSGGPGEGSGPAGTRALGRGSVAQAPLVPVAELAEMFKASGKHGGCADNANGTCRF